MRGGSDAFGPLAAQPRAGADQRLADVNAERAGDIVGSGSPSVDVRAGATARKPGQTGSRHLSLHHGIRHHHLNVVLRFDHRY